MQARDETVRFSRSHFPQTEQYSAPINMTVLLQGIRSVLLGNCRYLPVWRCTQTSTMSIFTKWPTRCSCLG